MDRYISSKEFRKLDIITELLTQRFSRKKIRWYCEEDGWSIMIDDKDAIYHVYLTYDDVMNRDTMDLLKLIIDGV